MTKFRNIPIRSELNLGVEQTGFTIVKCYKPSEEMEPFVRVCFLPLTNILFHISKQFIQTLETALTHHKMCVHFILKGGSVLRLFHKELEAYLVAEGLFEEQLTEEGSLT